MKNSSAAIIGLGILCIGIYLVFITMKYFASSLASANPNIIVALIAGMFTMSGYYISRYLERKRIIEQQIREQKLPVYEEFISFIFRIITNVKDKKETTEAEMQEFIMNFTKKSIVWLSDDSLQAYIRWKKAAGNISKDKKDEMQEVMKQMIHLEDMFFAFRKDIGHSNNGLKRGDLLALFITDLHNYDLSK